MLDIPQAVDNIMKVGLLLRCYTYQNIAQPWEHHILLRRRGGGWNQRIERLEIC